VDARLLGPAGYRIEGPGCGDDGEVAGQYWWTLYRDGWSGVEVGGQFPTAYEAERDALQALLDEEDLDWATRSIRAHAQRQFPDEFEALMSAQGRQTR
jgi:hypothetical protein